MASEIIPSGSIIQPQITNKPRYKPFSTNDDDKEDSLSPVEKRDFWKKRLGEFDVVVLSAGDFCHIDSWWARSAGAPDFSVRYSLGLRGALHTSSKDTFGVPKVSKFLITYVGVSVSLRLELFRLLLGLSRKLAA